MPKPLPIPYVSGFEPLSAEQRDRLMPDALPVAVKPDQAAKGVIICWHGFTGTPYEVTPVAKACAAEGFYAVAPLFPGHGYQARSEQRKYFCRMTLERMHQAAHDEITKARQQYDWVGMFGLSMGGAVALTMASEGLIDACATGAPALQLPPMAETLLPILGWANFSVPKKPERRFYLPTYQFYNSWALRELRNIGRYARRQLPAIQCPILVVHSRNDRTISPIVADWVEAETKIPVEVQWFDRSDHCLPLDVQGQEVSEAIAAFFSRQFLKASEQKN